MKRFLCLLFLAFVSQAQAAVKFEAEQWYGIEFHITISGEIEAGDSDRFKQLILAQLRASHLISQFNIYSSGGNVDEAFKMGEQIRALAVPTNAPELLDNKPRCTMGSLDAQTTRVGGSCDCQSACFLLWVAGIGRSGTYIGIHRPHYLNGPTRQKEFVEQYSELMSKTKDYFRKLNLPDWVFPRLYSVASQDMLLLPLNYFQDLQNNRIDLEEYILQKCGKEPGGTLYTSKERKAYIECKMPAIDTALAEGASKYLSLYGNPSEVFIQAPPSQPSPSVRQSFLLVAPPPNPMIAPPQPAAPPEVPDKSDCAKMTGDDVIVDVRYGDPDGGLVVRAEPRVSGDRLGLIPSDGVGVRREECDTNNWCKVRYECLSGWVSASFLSPKQSHVFRVTGVSANDRDGGLNVRAGPGVSFSVTGTVPYNATDVVRHNCEVKNGQEWCLITSRTISGWAAGRYLAR